jgi:hypothetical protein
MGRFYQPCYVKATLRAIADEGCQIGLTFRRRGEGSQVVEFGLFGWVPLIGKPCPPDRVLSEVSRASRVASTTSLYM